jgi:hypothetical protein
MSEATAKMKLGLYPAKSGLAPSTSERVPLTSLTMTKNIVCHTDVDRKKIYRRGYAENRAELPGFSPKNAYLVGADRAADFILCSQRDLHADVLMLNLSSRC